MGVWYKSFSMIYGCGIFNKLCVFVLCYVEEIVFMVIKYVVLKYGNKIIFLLNGILYINLIKFVV